MSLCSHWTTKYQFPLSAHGVTVAVTVSLLPAGYFVDKGQKFASLVGDSVLADVNVTLLQRMLDEGGDRFTEHWRPKELEKLDDALVSREDTKGKAE